MFDNIKNIYNLKKQAEELQKQMSHEQISATVGAATVTLNGNFELTELKISEAGNATQLEKDIKAAYHKAQDQIKQIMATKFRGMV